MRLALSIGQASRFLGVDPNTLARWIKSGKLPSVTTFATVGGHLRIEADSFRSYLREQGLCTEKLDTLLKGETTA